MVVWKEDAENSRLGRFSQGGGGNFHFLVKDFFVVAGNAEKVKSQDNGSLTQTQSCTQLLPFPPQFLFNFNPGLKLYRTA